MARRRDNAWVSPTLALVLLTGTCGVADCLAENPRYKGRTVSSVLADLEDAGLQFLYSSDLIAEGLRVSVEPQTRDRLSIAREILAAHGLALRTATPTLYLVTRASSGEPAQRLAGRVVDAHSGDALPGARVELLPIGRIAWSDLKGQFRFEGIPAGDKYRLRASIEDYAHGELPVQVAPGLASEDTVRLQRVALDTVVVEASRYALAADNHDAQRLAAADLRDQPDVAEDPIRALRRLPGVVQGAVSAASNLRGSEVSDLMLLLDGFPLRQPYHLPSYQRPFSLLDEDLVGGIDVYTGGFPARFGNRLGGVFDVSSTDAAQAPRSSIGLSFFNARARTAGVSEDMDTRWRAAARLGTLRSLLQYFAVEAGSPSYGDVSLLLSQRVSDSVSITGNLLWAEDEYRLVEDDENAELASRTRYGWLRADFASSERLDGSVWLGHTRLASDRTGIVDKPELASGAVDDHRSAELWDLRADLNWRWSERSRLNAGFEWAEGESNYLYGSSVEYPEEIAEFYGLEPGITRNVRVAPHQRRIAGWLSQRVRILDRVIPELGLRAQYFDIDGLPDEFTWDPRLGVRWEIHPRTSLRAHWGRFHQADEAHELAVADGVADFSPAQRSEHLILGLEHRFTNGVQLRVEAFHKQQTQVRARFENLLNPIEVLPEIAPDRVRVAPQEAVMRGLELSMAFEGDSWRGWTSLAVSDAVDRFNGAEVPRSWDQRLGWSGGIEWQRGLWRVGAAATVHSGWPTTPAIELDGELTLGSRNTDRLSTFAALNVRVEYRRPIAVGSLAIALEVANLTNRRNECCVEVELDDEDSDEPVLTPEKQYWPGLVPSLSIEWEM